MNEAIKELEHIEEWLNGLGEGWNYFGGVDRAKQRLKNTMNIIHNAQNQPSCLGAALSRFNSDTFIDNVCLSYRHDFILMAEQDRQRLRFECKEWMRAISNNWEYFKNGL